MIPSDLSSVWNHLWQSTLCAGVIWLLTVALRENRAAVRYWLWFAASVKFLVPFSLLVRAGSHLEWRSAPVSVEPALASIVEQVSVPFALPVAPPPATSPSFFPTALYAIWLCGVAIGAIFCVRFWRQVRDARRSATPLPLNLPIPAMSAAGRIEPGVFGIIRPVLLLPRGIADRLTPAQLHAVIAHELCHVRRRDNLTGAIHMVVETLFWFHPLVWWLRARLVEERERACDEHVLAQADPHVYAEGILNVCKFYLESPLVCAAGVTGADLKKRIEKIMTARRAYQLDLRRKALLVLVCAAAVTLPVAAGLMNVPARAQTGSEAPLRFEVASVKPNKSGDTERAPARVLPGGGYTATNNTVRALILSAYGIYSTPYLLEGGPGWIDSARYDVDAKPEGGVIPPGAHGLALWGKTREMLRTLLADRFKLSVRRETREMPLYELVVAKGGTKLQKSDANCQADFLACHGFAGNPRHLMGAGVDMADIAGYLSSFAGRLVVDKTGLPGVFDVKLQWNPFAERTQPPDETPRAPGTERREGPMPDLASLPNMFTALETQAGLKLESRKGPVDVYVIERVAKPSEN